MVDTTRHPHIGTWDHHRVYDYGEFVVKLPTATSSISMSQARWSVAFFQDYFGEFVPETYIEKSKLYPYVASQKKINGTLLAEKFLHDIPSEEIIRQLEVFVMRAINIGKQKKIVFDIIWSPYDTSHHRDSLLVSTNFLIEATLGREKLVFVDTIASCKCISESRYIRHIKYHTYDKRRQHIDGVLRKYNSIFSDIQSLKSY